MYGSFTAAELLKSSDQSDSRIHLQFVGKGKIATSVSGHHLILFLSHQSSYLRLCPVCPHHHHHHHLHLCHLHLPPPSLSAREENSTGEVFNSNFICSSAARKLTQQSLESKVALGSALTVLYANRAAPGQWSRPAESLLMQI